MKLRNILLALVFMAVLAGCGDTPTATPVGNPSPTGQTSQNTPQAQATTTADTVPTRVQITSPVFTYMPRIGAAGTVVSLTGANFKPGSKVALRIGNPQPVGEPLATADVGSDGRWATTVTIPGTLPSGKPLVSVSPGDVQIVAMDENNAVIATQPFDLVAAGSTGAANAQANDPTAAVKDFLSALQRDPTAKSGEQFLSTKFRSQIESGTPVTALFNLQGIPTGFTVGTAVASGTPNSVQVPVSLTTATGTTDLTFNMIRQVNAWVIDSVAGK